MRLHTSIFKLVYTWASGLGGVYGQWVHWGLWSHEQTLKKATQSSSEPYSRPNENTEAITKIYSQNTLDTSCFFYILVFLNI